MLVIGGGATKQNLDIIDAILGRAARFCFNNSKFDSISSGTTNILKWVNIYNMHKIELSKIAHQAKYNYTATYIKDFVNFENATVRTTRGKSYATATATESPYLIIETWSAICVNIRNISLLSLFSRKVKEAVMDLDRRTLINNTDEKNCNDIYDAVILGYEQSAE